LTAALTEIPNLRAKSIKAMWNWIVRTQPANPSQREERAQMVFGAVLIMFSAIFSTTVLALIYLTGPAVFSTIIIAISYFILTSFPVRRQIDWVA